MLKTSRILEIIEELRVESSQISDSNYRYGYLFAIAKILDRISEELNREYEKMLGTSIRLEEGTKNDDVGLCEPSEMKGERQ